MIFLYYISTLFIVVFFILIFYVSLSYSCLYLIYYIFYVWCLEDYYFVEVLRSKTNTILFDLNQG